MNEINNQQAVQTQYATPENLQNRINIHLKYSTNKKGFSNWIFEQYEILDGDQILELGCGDVSFWSDKLSILPENITLNLTDFCVGMLKTAVRNIVDKRVSFHQVDIQNIPFAENSFNCVFANMMLYHVPNLNQALSEVNRVLCKKGKFYTTTFGENGILKFLSEVFSDYGITAAKDNTFTLQNGADILKTHFSNVKRLDYKDSLAITNSADLVEYALTLNPIVNFSQIPKETMIALLDERKIDGIITVPKEYGMFICEK